MCNGTRRTNDAHASRYAGKCGNCLCHSEDKAASGDRRVVRYRG